MYNFCTLFDINYIHRGLALHNSLKKHCPQFHLWILCMDEDVFSVLEKLNLDSVTLIKLKDFEDEDLLKVKNERTKGEYCWTCASNFIWFLLHEHHEIEAVTYLDADLYFFNDPKILIEELGDDDVLITEHRYTKKYDQTKTSGKYCVQFMTFKNNEQGMHILEWWRQQCIQWCFARFEDGKFGDQKYLDDWMERFEGVHVLQNIGGGVAPWNVQQYEISKDGDDIFVSEKNNKLRLVFYHFHSLKFIEGRRLYLGIYELPISSKKLLYTIYLSELFLVEKELFKKGFKLRLFPPISSKNIVKSLLRYFRKGHNVFFVKDIINSDK